jgi:hypothetical protein
MAPFFRKKSPMQKLETELASLRARAETLSNRHAAADAAFVDAKSKLRRHHLEADLDADEKAGAQLEAAVAACALTRDGFADAIGDVRKMIADIEQKIAAEREAVERAKAAEKLEHDLDEIERALPDYLTAARRFADALESIHFHYESAEMARFVRNGQAQVEIAAAMALQELRGMAAAIRDGAAPIPPRKPEPEPVQTIEAAPPTQIVFLVRSVKFKNYAGKTVHGLQYMDCEMPLETAQRALRCGAAVSLANPRRRELHGARGGVHVDPNSPDLLDLDAVEEAKVPYNGPDSNNPVLAAARFTRVDRGPARTLSIAVPRI